MASVPAALHPSEEDMLKLLACQAHVGTRNLDAAMGRYMWKRRQDGVYVINLHKTWEKLMLAARMIVAIENPADVCVLSARPWGQRAVLKFAHYTGATAIAGRFTPGTFTNQIQPNFAEPRLLVLNDSRTDHQPIRESAYVSIPTIAFCHSDSPAHHVDCAIPCNNKGKQSIALMWWLLSREVLRMRKQIDRKIEWDVMVDMYIYRDPDEQEKDEQALADAHSYTAPQAAEAPGPDAAATGGDWQSGWASATGPDWNNAPAASGDWASEVTPAAAPAGETWDSSVAVSDWSAPAGDAPQQ